MGTATDQLTLGTFREKLPEKYKKNKARKLLKSEDSDSDEEEKSLFEGGKFK